MNPAQKSGAETKIRNEIAAKWGTCVISRIPAGILRFGEAPCGSLAPGRRPHLRTGRVEPQRQHVTSVLAAPRPRPSCRRGRPPHTDRSGACRHFGGSIEQRITYCGKAASTRGWSRLDRFHGDQDAVDLLVDSAGGYDDDRSVGEEGC